MGDKNNTNNTSNQCNDTTNGFREAVCIHTDKVYDSCREQGYASYIIYSMLLFLINCSLT